MRRLAAALLLALLVAAGVATWLLTRPEPAVRVDARADRVVVENRDGAWTVFTRCVPGRVGPGYVARLESPHGLVLVDDVRGPGTLNDTDFGGLGAFGWHHARGRPGAVRFDADNAWEVSVRQCAAANGGFGVAGARLAEPPERDGDGVSFAVEVDLSDGFTHPAPLMRVRYDYRAEPDALVARVAATELCPAGRCGRTDEIAFLKEPKLVAHVSRPFARMAVYDEAGRRLCAGRPVGPPAGPILETTQCDQPGRALLRFEPCAPDCLRVSARAAETTSWAGAAAGFDGWARAAAKRAAAFPVDTPSTDGVRWGCHGGSPADARMRRWELAGRRGGSLGALFPAWEGGRGGYDCEPLARTFGPRGATWVAYLAYSLGVR